ncbi:hypothetical protein J7T55_004559 [Diaporthe amygdali]|uniref:uncharacterized protein n=1 Tax=Phomopsis amygdali TaxID=1214568 RepID=UPI0022FE7C40|nr:uncharacterized protein J7T55_004559 [Diaporthe amygdali]KAJ0114817.1 hypothetical protein J7T55_004559 [Diaporthe amygdali]
MTVSPFVLRSGYIELAKVVHSTCGSLTTVFLFTRLWARVQHYHGLWRDDYVLIAAWVCLLLSNGFGAAGPAYGFNVLDGSAHGQVIHFTAVSFMYAAIALSKTAFAITLLRLTSGRRSKGILWLVMVLTNSFNLALFILTWLDICDTRFDLAHIPGRCISMFVATWLHMGAAINSLLCDLILTCYPWWIISQVAYIPPREKWGVTASMSLVGVSILVEIAKIIIFSLIPADKHGEVDYTYGVVAVCCFHQAEAAVFIIAQTIPVIRVMFQSDHTSHRSTTSSRAVSTKSKTAKPAPVNEGTRSVELLQLPSGRIVTADSDEGRAFQNQRDPEGPKTQDMQPPDVTNLGRNGLIEESLVKITITAAGRGAQESLRANDFGTRS